MHGPIYHRGVLSYSLQLDKRSKSSQENAVADEKQGSPARTVRTKKTQMNYASQDCGAKVLSHNSEAKVRCRKVVVVSIPLSICLFFCVECRCHFGREQRPLHAQSLLQPSLVRRGAL